MASNIDPTKPTAGIALTQDVRDNFGSAKTEIEALQTSDASQDTAIADNAINIIAAQEDIALNAADIAALQAAGQGFGKNYIINPTFSINQRGFAGGALSSGAYGVDRWVSANVSLSVTLPDANGFITISGATDNFGLRQKLESFGADLQVTLSWEGTAQGQFFRASSDVWTTPANSPITLTLASGDNAGTKEFFNFGNGTLKNVKLEIGSIATPFEYPDPATELAKCKRYYIGVGNAPALQGAMNETGGNALFSLSESSYLAMRATPALAVVNTTEVVHRPGFAFIGISSVFTFNTDYLGVILDTAVPANINLGLLNGVFTADAEL